VDLSGPRTVDGDLDDPQKVAEMVRRFYADVAQDTLLGPVFNDVAHTDWAAHGRTGQGPRPQGRRRALPTDRRRTRQITFHAAGTNRGVGSKEGVNMP